MSRGRRHNAKGRSRSGKPFVRLEWWILDGPAYRALKPTARALLIELARRHNGYNNGSIGLGEREAAFALGMSDRRAVRAHFAELEAKGFIVCTWRGVFHIKAGPQRASEWRLTWEPTPDGKPATKEFARWTGNEPQQNSRERISHGSGQVSTLDDAPRPRKIGRAE